MNKYLKESILWALLALPCVYLMMIWDKLPERVPTHFNLSGNADDWSGKTALLFFPLIGIFIYFLMLIIPKIDPKKKMEQMGDKYYTLRFILTFFLAILTIYCLYLSSGGSLKSPGVMVALIGGLFAVFGNYFQTMRPNYFIGIRTPWTLESETVWKKTHRLSGKLWITGGTLIVILALVINSNLALAITFGTIILVLVLIPVAFSYIEFRKEKKVLN